MMEALHTVKNEYTYKEYRKFSYYCLRSSWVVLAICCAVMIALLVNSIMEGYVLPACIATLFFVGVPFFIEYTIKKAYVTKKTNGEEVTIRFYEDHIEGEIESSVSKVFYKNLFKVAETKTSFYIMIGNNQGFIVVKEKCSPELIEFIRNLKKAE